MNFPLQRPREETSMRNYRSNFLRPSRNEPITSRLKSDRRGIIIQETYDDSESSQNHSKSQNNKTRIIINMNNNRPSDHLILREKFSKSPLEKTFSRPSLNRNEKMSNHKSPSSTHSFSSSDSLDSFPTTCNNSDQYSRTLSPQRDDAGEEYDLKELTEDDVQFLLDNTGFTKDQISRWHSDFLQKCTTGLISSTQFKAYYSLLLPAQLRSSAKDQVLNKLFQLFDIDGDGCLNFAEFLVSFWIRCKAPIREKYTWIFNMLDNDRNGYLSYAEIKNALTLCLNVNDLEELLKELSEKCKCQQSTKSIDRFNFTELFESAESDLEDFDNSLIINNSFNQKQDLFSRSSSKLLEDKIDETVLLLFSALKDLQIAEASSNQVTSLSANSIQKSSQSQSVDSLNSSVNNYFKGKIEIDRQGFLDLCDKYKLFRKLLLPINYFYDENLEFY